MQKFEYGAMSSMFSVEAENKLTAYAAMIIQYDRSAHLIALYSPEECKEDSWTTFDGKISARLHQIYGGKPEEPDSFAKYLDAHKDEIIAAWKTIKRIV